MIYNRKSVACTAALMNLEQLACNRELLMIFTRCLSEPSVFPGKLQMNLHDSQNNII